MEGGGQMIRIQFTNSKSFYDVEFSLEGNTVRLEGKKFPKKMKGFKAYRLNGDLLGDYSDHTNFEPTEGGFIFTKDTDTNKE